MAHSYTVPARAAGDSWALTCLPGRLDVADPSAKPSVVKESKLKGDVNLRELETKQARAASPAQWWLRLLCRQLKALQWLHRVCSDLAPSHSQDDKLPPR